MYILLLFFLSVSLGLGASSVTPHLHFTDSLGREVDVLIPGTTLQSKFPFYHSTSEIHEKILQHEKSCHVPIKVKSKSCGNDCVIDIVDIGHSGAKEKVFLLFGEHARELVSPETAIGLIEALCSESDGGIFLKSEALKVAQYRIIPNGNPSSRSKVELGQYCLRTNQNGVDLNRNWGYQWSPTAPPGSPEADQLEPGSGAFSERETKIFKSAVEEFRPTVFAAIHSGTMGMYMPWAYSSTPNGRAKKMRNSRKMKEVLSELDSKYCQCPSGAAAEEVGYDSAGTCLDWVHSRTTAKYSFAFEIFTGNGVEELRQRYKNQKIRGGNSLLQISLEDQESSQMDCFEQFNPKTFETYKTVIDNWTKALIELPIMTSRK